MRNLKKMFTPGAFSGAFAAGDRVAASSAQIVSAIKEAGGIASKKSEFYPWLTCVPITIGAAATAAPVGTIAKFIRQDAQDPAFRNGTAKRVWVDEMRIAALNLAFADEALSFGLDAALTLGAFIRTPRQVYVDQWVPLAYLNNHVGTFNRSVTLKGAYELPTPYFLEMKSPLKMRVRQRFQGTETGDLTCWFGVFGVGADGFPIEIVKRLDLPAKTPFVPPYYYDIVFDDNRDRLLRDSWITHVGFAFGELNFTDMSDPTDAPHAVLSALELQFRPLSGPSWQRDDDWIPLWMLQDQPGMVHDITSGTADFSQIIHKFESPLFLNPKDEIKVDLHVNAQNVPGGGKTNFFGDDYPIWCAFYGRQEA